MKLKAKHGIMITRPLQHSHGHFSIKNSHNKLGFKINNLKTTSKLHTQAARVPPAPVAAKPTPVPLLSLSS
jgi:hypothetical protein